MRGTPRLACALLLGAVTLAACARPAPPPEPVVEQAGDGLLRLSSTGRTASAAVESGLNHATRYCAARNGMIAVEGTQIEARGYHLRFRCLETGTVATAAPASGAPLPTPAAAAPDPRAVIPVSVVTGAPLAPVPAAAAPQASPARTGQVLPGATRALAPIAAGTPPQPATARPPAAATASPPPPSSFWQSGR